MFSMVRFYHCFVRILIVVHVRSLHIRSHPSNPCMKMVFNCPHFHLTIILTCIIFFVLWMVSSYALLPRFYVSFFSYSSFTNNITLLTIDLGLGFKVHLWGTPMVSPFTSRNRQTLSRKLPFSRLKILEIQYW